MPESPLIKRERTQRAGAVGSRLIASYIVVRPEEYIALDATGLAALVHRGEVTPLELTEAAIERIEALNARLNAVVETDYGGARAAARAMDMATPLAGVPFLAKDMNIEVAGLRLTSSCRWLEGLPPATVDAPLAARWRSAGLTLPLAMRIISVGTPL